MPRTYSSNRRPRADRRAPGPAPPGWPDSRTESSAGPGRDAARPDAASSKFNQLSRSAAAKLSATAMPCRCAHAAQILRRLPDVDRCRRASRNASRIADAVRRSQAQQGFGQFRQQLHAVGHRIAAAIPFDDREFGIVQRPALARAKGSRDLIDGLAAGGQQSLHAELGRGLQPQLAANFRAPRIGGQHDAQRIEMAVDDHVGRQQRRLDFQKSSRGEKLTRAREQLGPQPQRRPIGGRQKIVGRKIGVHY